VPIVRGDPSSVEGEADRPGRRIRTELPAADVRIAWAGRSSGAAPGPQVEIRPNISDNSQERPPGSSGSLDKWAVRSGGGTSPSRPGVCTDGVLIKDKSLAPWWGGVGEAVRRGPFAALQAAGPPSPAAIEVEVGNRARKPRRAAARGGGGPPLLLDNNGKIRPSAKPWLLGEADGPFWEVVGRPVIRGSRSPRLAALGRASIGIFEIGSLTQFGPGPRISRLGNGGGGVKDPIALHRKSPRRRGGAVGELSGESASPPRGQPCSVIPPDRPVFGHHRIIFYYPTIASVPTTGALELAAGG